jgi:hypothetical protein
MKRLLLLFVLALPILAQAQQFEFLYDHNGFSNDGGNIIKTINGYFTTHYATDMELGSYSILMASFDQVGELLWDTSLTNSQTEFYGVGLYQNILPTSSENENWVVGNSIDDSTQLNTPFLLKVSLQGDLQQLNYFDTLYDIIPQLLNPQIFTGAAANGNLYFIGMYVANSNIYFLLYTCDLQGNYLWHRSYQSSWTIFPQCIIDVGDGIVVGAQRFNPSNPSDSERLIRKFDYDGNILWGNAYSAPLQPSYGVVSLAELSNGNYLFAGTKFIENVSIQPLIGELDSGTGDTLWTKLFFESQVYDANNLANFNSINRIYGFKQLSDGGFLGVGECRHDIIPDSAIGPLDNAAFMMKLDSNYNFLWKRIYIPEGYDELNISPAKCQLNDFVENEDGSITALGRVYMYTGTGPQGGYIQDSYMIRVDSLGCLIPGCSVGVTEIEDLNDLLVYPNPTSSNLTVQLPITDNWTVRLYNMNGQLVSTEKINQSNFLQLNIQNMNTGLYTVQAMNGAGRVYSEMVVKE